MHIIIVGGGGIGSALAKLLSKEKQDVIVIERDPEIARHLNAEIDGIVTCRNGASAAALEEVGIKNASMLIAVTEVDEVNMIACMLAKKFNVPITVARVRNPEYYEGSGILSNEQLGVDIFINPERIAAFEIIKLIRTPNVIETEYFAKGNIKMVSIIADEKTKLVNQPLKQLPLPKNCLVTAIERKSGEFLLPNGNDIIYPDDKVFFIGTKTLLNDINWLLQKKEAAPQNIIILGGGKIGFQLAEMLESTKKSSYNVKIIEKDPECCRNIADSLRRTLILEGDALDLSFLEQEDIHDTDVLVAVTGDDRTNILGSFLARHFGVKRIICEVINQEYFSLFYNMGFEYVISPRLLTASQIIRLVRKGEVVSMSLIEDGKAEIMELNIPETAKVVNKAIQNAGIPKGILIGAILRKNQIILPRGNDYLLPGDNVILFARPQFNDQIDRLFSANKTNNRNNKNTIYSF